MNETLRKQCQKYQEKIDKMHHKTFIDMGNPYGIRTAGSISFNLGIMQAIDYGDKGTQAFLSRLSGKIPEEKSKKKEKNKPGNEPKGTKKKKKEKHNKKKSRVEKGDVDSSSKGSYNSDGEITPEQGEEGRTLLRNFDMKVEVKLEDPNTFIPTVYLKMPTLFESTKQKKNEPPIILMRFDMSSYMTREMRQLCKNIVYIAEHDNIPLYYYRRFNGELYEDSRLSTLIDNKKEIYNKTRRNVLLFTCGCSGGGSFNKEGFVELNKHHNLIWMTHYKKGSNCGCSTFQTVRNMPDAALGRIIHEIV